MTSFIVGFWAKVFGLLSWLTPFQLARSCFPSMKKPGSVEVWVLTNVVASIFFLSLPDVQGWSWWEVFLVAYAAIRTVEVVIYQINVLLFDAYRKRKAGGRYQLRGLRRLVLLLLHNYVELIFWFAVIYRHMSASFLPITDSFGRSLSMSFTTMSGFGTVSIQSITPYSEVVLQLQAVVGFIMALIVLARFISLIPEPETADEIEQCERPNSALKPTAPKRRGA